KPMELYENQDFERYDIMTGVTNDEGLVFTNFFGGIFGGLNVTNGVSRETFLAFLRGGGLSRVIPDPKSVLINTTIYRYTDYTNVSSPIINRRMYVDLQSDMGFLAPAIRAANALVKKKAKTYFYLFEHRYGDLLMGSKLPSWVESYHGADVAFVFGFPLMSSSPVTTETDARFTRDIIRYWTNFAKTGDPNSPVRVDVTWPEYNQEQQQYISLKPNMSIHSHLRADFMAYWNCLISEALRAASEPCGAHQSHVEKQSTEGKEEL
ncbi:Acetylcholinesterase, partial [Exaiptasia diaphana]